MCPVQFESYLAPLDFGMVYYKAVWKVVPLKHLLGLDFPKLEISDKCLLVVILSIII
jgi:hypothetical protein